MSEGNARRFFGHFALSLVLIRVIMGCGAPAVSHTSISGEVRNVEHWALEWVSQNDTRQKQPTPAVTIGKQSKYTLAEYCNGFVDEIKQTLAREYGFEFVDNFPTDGRIVVELVGERFLEYVPPADTSRRDLYPDMSPDARDAATDEGFNLSGALERLFTDDDQVRQVRLKIHDRRNVLAGEVFIGGSMDDKVKPDFVAKVIDRVIRTGKYK